jgi:hypothetical protein
MRASTSEIYLVYDSAIAPLFVEGHIAPNMLVMQSADLRHNTFDWFMNYACNERASVWHIDYTMHIFIIKGFPLCPACILDKHGCIVHRWNYSQCSRGLTRSYWPPLLRPPYHDEFTLVLPSFVIQLSLLALLAIALNPLLHMTEKTHESVPPRCVPT